MGSGMRAVYKTGSGMVMIMEWLGRVRGLWSLVAASSEVLMEYMSSPNDARHTTDVYSMKVIGG